MLYRTKQPQTYHRKGENTKGNRDIGLGRRKSTDGAAAAHPTPKQAKAAPKSNPPTNATKIRVTNYHCTVSMFPDCTKKQNRRMTPKEKETEIWLAGLFKRPTCEYIYDMPTYPYLPKKPPFEQYNVNFDLNYQ